MFGIKHIPQRTLFLILTLLIIHSTFYIAQATVRYVSHSGNNTLPYTSWATAADSIMSAINISVFGDTIYVDNGVYKERVDMIPGLTLIGAGMDSCVIDTREFPTATYSVRVTDSCYLAGFQINTFSNTQGAGIYVYDLNIEIINAIVEENKITDSGEGIRISSSSLGFDDGYKLVQMNIITNVQDGITVAQTAPLILDNIIYPREDGLVAQIISSPTYINNIIVFDNVNGSFGFRDFGSNSILKNNLIYGKGSYGFWTYGDSIVNNVLYGQDGNWNRGIFGAGSDIRNNNVQNASIGLFYDTGGGNPPVYQYNNMWGNNTNFQNFSPDTTNIFVNPMFVNEDSMDFHLQIFSPLINAGDPNILDKDGSRSDIGLFGGPYGEKYTYRDLAPKPPSNLTAEYDSGLVKLTWNKNTEADFYRYRVYRDTVANFMYDTTKIIAVVADTFYYDDIPEKYIAGNYYYKLTAIDSTGNQSAPSEEVHITVTGIPEAPPIVVEHYQLLNNYPNPFNSSTVIPYRLKEAGYVKLYVYDIKGELVRTLVNQYQSAGYYEVKFSPTREERKNGEIGEGWWTGYNDDIATGIYIYQLMVRGKGDIPVFSDLKKMILLK